MNNYTMKITVVSVDGSKALATFTERTRAENQAQAFVVKTLKPLKDDGASVDIETPTNATVTWPSGEMLFVAVLSDSTAQDPKTGLEVGNNKPWAVAPKSENGSAADLLDLLG